MKPLARRARLVTRALPDELLVYDLDRHRAHCLNATAALVFQHCDGQTSVAEIAEHLHRELDAPADEDLVWLSLKRLDREHLLAARPSPPDSPARLSRRELVRRVGLAALPVVATVLAPTPAEAVVSNCVSDCSSAPDGTPCWCTDAGLECDSNNCSAGVCSAGC